MVSSKMDEKTTLPFWNPEWLEAQRQYWDAWASLSQKAREEQVPGGMAGAAGAEALDHWWKAVAPAAPGESYDFFTHVIDQAKAFFAISDEFTKFLHDMAETAGSSEYWVEQLDSRFAQMTASIKKSHAGVSDAMRGMDGFWTLPLDTWQRMVSSMSVLPGDILKGLKPEGVRSAADQFLSVPGVGYTREWQEQVQEWLRLGGEYQTAIYEYVNAFGKVGIDALEHLKQKIVDIAEEGKDLKSLREVYDLWVDCSEAAYAEFVLTEEYAELYGRLVNALMALKHRGRSMVDEALGGMNMPSRTDFDTVQSRQQELRRELKAVRAELNALKAELQGSAGITPKRRTPTRTEPVTRSRSGRKKATVKRKRRVTKSTGRTS